MNTQNTAMELPSNKQEQLDYLRSLYTNHSISFESDIYNCSYGTNNNSHQYSQYK